MSRSTLVRAPPIDSSKSLIENTLQLTALSDVQPDLFTNTRELWHPPNARGIYGGVVIAQCLLAACKTIPEPSSLNKHAVFYPHSMHCYFILAGNATIPILFHVERVRDGRSFITRTVQARQRGKCIFTTTISFVAEASGGDKKLQHGADMAPDAVQKLERTLASKDSKNASGFPNWMQDHDEENQSPFSNIRLGIANNQCPDPHERHVQSWVKCRGKIQGGLSAHLSALAYMSDNTFIGVVSKVHEEIIDHDSNGGAPKATTNDRQRINTPGLQPDARIGMMVSLDHTIYFHRPTEIKADEWLFAEMESPWANEGRGVVTQKIWNKEGRLLATCVQEGLVRLQQDEHVSKKSKL